MTDEKGKNKKGVSRRSFMIGGGAAAGLLVAWGAWPRNYADNIIVADGEYAFGDWLKITSDGQVVIGIAQSEMGQGVYTLLAQIIADELGADWRTIAIQPVMPAPIFANIPLAKEWSGAFLNDDWDARKSPDSIIEEYARRNDFVVTAGSSSLRAFEAPCREAGAIARVMLCQAAADKWNVDWEECSVSNGIIAHGEKSLPFAELAEIAAQYDAPDPVPLKAATDDVGSQPGDVSPMRLDVAAKVDGSISFAGDIRLTDMVYASVRAGPIGDTKFKSMNLKTADDIDGLITVFHTENWLAALGSNWWTANRALDEMAPVYETRGAIANSEEMLESMKARLSSDSGWITHKSGDFAETVDPETGNRQYSASYNIAPSLHAPIETRSATAHYKDGRLKLWLATQAPHAARAAAAKAIGISENDVVLFPMMAGGSFGRNLDCLIAEQAAILTKSAKRPVQVIWSRPEDFMRDYVRPPAYATLRSARDIDDNLIGYSAHYATPSTMREQVARINGDTAVEAQQYASGQMDALAIDGSVPPYDIPNVEIAHYPTDLPLYTGRYRGNGDNITAFTRECFIDELARKMEREPLSYRMGMLANQTRLARCLSRVAILANWDGGAEQSGKGLACHSMRGGHIALIAQAQPDESGIKVRNIYAVVDAGKIKNREIALQQIEGGIIFGIAQALGATTQYDRGLPVARRLRDLALPRLEDIPEITIEFINSVEESAGLGEIGVPAVAPALANALYSASGIRIREMPLLSRGL